MPFPLIRVLAVLNLVLGGFAFLVVPVLMFGAMAQPDPEKKTFGLVMTAWLGAYLVLYLLSGYALWTKKRWGRWLTLVLSGLLFLEGIWHLVRGEWGVVVFCVAYAALAAWLLVPRHAEEYFVEP